jgi:hypothetical protein
MYPITDTIEGLIDNLKDEFKIYTIVNTISLNKSIKLGIPNNHELIKLL